MQRRRLSDAIVSQIAFDILSGVCDAGALLPSEPQLCDRFAVSRTVVRDATSRLQRMGLVHVRQGLGTIARARSDWHEFDPELISVRARTGQIADLTSDLLEIRRMVEIEGAGLAAERRTAADIVALRHLLEEMGSAIHDPHRYNDTDIDFHELLITATRNDLMRQMIRPINELRRIGSSIITLRTKGTIESSNEGHRAILDAVEEQSVAAARSAMAQHIAQFEEDLVRTFNTPGDSSERPVLVGAVQ